MSFPHCTKRIPGTHGMSSLVTLANLHKAAGRSCTATFLSWYDGSPRHSCRAKGYISLYRLLKGGMAVTRHFVVLAAFAEVAETRHKCRGTRYGLSANPYFAPADMT